MYQMFSLIKFFVQAIPRFTLRNIQGGLKLIYECIFLALIATKSCLFLFLILVLMEIDFLFVCNISKFYNETLTLLIFTVSERLLFIKDNNIVTIGTLLSIFNIH